MRTLVIAATIVAGSLAAVSPVAASGGMGGYGGGMPSSGPMFNGPADDYTSAVRLIRHEKYEDAIPYLLRALEKRPHSADVLNYLGFTNRMIGRFSTSMAFYQQALKEDPDHKGAHEYLGELYLNLHDLASAQGQLAELTRICPSDCDERDTLTKSIASFEAANSPATSPAPASAAPATQPPGGN